MAVAASDADLELADWVATCYADPYTFVLGAYPWGEPGFLQYHDGPDTWQAEWLIWLGEEIKARGFDGHHTVAPIRRGTSSGHGTGKSSLVGMVAGFCISTRANLQGTVTASTTKQLETKTWATIRKWMKVCITSHWFMANDERIYRKGAKESWFIAPQSSKEENADSFQGQHAADSTSLYIMDEDSGIPDKIHEVAEGGLTDGEPMIFLFGNMTRSQGAFHKAVFGSDRKRWNPLVLDSRDSAFTNKETIAEWVQLYGEDSDFVRVRVRGLPPRASDAQFIDQTRVTEAQDREVVVFDDEPIICGCDLAWGGGDDNVIRFRQGLDARSIPSIRIKGEFTRDPTVLTTRLAEVLTREFNGQKVAMLFLDSAGIAGNIGFRLRQLGHRNVQEINFGADAPQAPGGRQLERYYRDYMWARMKEWLLVGAVDNNAELEQDLVGPGVVPNSQQLVQLESKKDMKKRDLDSPDDGDALALTFAAPVLSPSVKLQRNKRRPQPSRGWMG